MRRPVEYKSRTSPPSDKTASVWSYSRAKGKRDVKIHSPPYGMTNKWEADTGLLPFLSLTIRH
jgi:hypothetical protein